MSINRYVPLLSVLLPAALGRAQTDGSELQHNFHNTAVAVVVTLDTFTPDPPPQVAPPADQFAQWAGRYSIHPPGTYQITTVQVLKGDATDLFSVHLPQVSSAYYVRHPFPLDESAPVLLLLEKDADGALVPVDPYLPVVPLSAAAAKAPQDPKQKPDPLGVILASLDDESLRPTLLSLLTRYKDPRVDAAASACVTDPDEEVQCYALGCMAVNQNLTAIPLIAKLSYDREPSWIAHKAFAFGPPVDALCFYTNAKAIPLLNPLLLHGENTPQRGANIGDPVDMLRLNAMDALRLLADKSSVPYLMYALNHDDQQHTVSFTACAALHRILADQRLPPASTWRDFIQSRDHDVDVLNQWWATAQKSWNPATLPAIKS